MSLFSRRISALGTENAFKLGDHIKTCSERGLEIIKFNLGEPDFDSPDAINEAGVAEIRKGNSHYCDPAGVLPLRKAIADHVESSRGISVSPDQVIVTAGGKPSIGYTLQTYVDPGDEVIYPSPGFPIYESWVEFVGATPVPIQLPEENGFALTAEALEAAITDKTKLIILCSPSNPTGGVYPREELEGIARVIREKGHPDLRIYSDEIYEDILFDGEAHTSIVQFEGMAQRTILASGMSKSYAMTGWRLGYSVLPTVEEATIFKQLNINIVSCVPPFIQEAGRVALTNDEVRTKVEEMVREFEARRDWVVPALNELPGVTCQLPKGAFYVFPNVGGACERLGAVEFYEALSAEEQATTNPSKLFQMFLLYRYGVASMDRESFGKVGARGQHFLRLSIASAMDQLKEGVKRIGRAIADKDGFHAFLQEEDAWR